MRFAFSLALLLCVSPLLAEEATLASRFPAGATAYVEMRGLGPRLDQALKSSLGESIRTHPAVQQFLNSPPGMQLLFAQGMLQGATGLDYVGLIRAVAGREVGVAVYGKPQRVVLMARVDGKTAETLIAGAEMITSQERTVVLEKDEKGPALFKLGPVYVQIHGDLLVASPDQLLATSVRNGTVEGLASSATYRDARCLVDRESLLFGYVDLKPFAAALQKNGKPGDLGQAFILGAFAHYVRKAPWAAFGLDIAPNGDGGWAIKAQGHLPVPNEPSAAVSASYAGTLDPLPFALPKNTIGVLRMRRDLKSMWTHRDALIAGRGLPQLVEFESNFETLTGGMKWVDEFLPKLGDELILLGTRREYEQGKPAPAVRIPQGAIIFPFEVNDRTGQRLEVAFHQIVAIINFQVKKMGSKPLLPSTETYKERRVISARYMTPGEGEMEGRKALPLQYNFEPSFAVLDRHVVIASTTSILKEVIDGYGQPGPAPKGVNAGFWIKPSEARRALLENRESLIAQRMLEKGEDRAAASKMIDLGLELGRYLRAFSITVDESRAALGGTLEVIFGPAKE